ncbi:MAG: hypothetical protein R2761_15140 [Acidimicrobiales bacterium]
MAALGATVMAALLAPPPAGAESPTVLAAELAIDGAYVAPERTDVSEADLVEQTGHARALGLRLVVVVPNDPRPNAEAFARRVLEATDSDVALVFPPGGGLEASVADDLQSQSLRALSAARSKADPVLATEVYIDTVLAEPSRSVPAVVSRTVLAVLILAVVLGGVVLAEQAIRRAGSSSRELVSKRARG